MSELRSVVEALRADELGGLPDARIEEDFAELQRGIELLEVERLRRLREIERRGSFARDGFLSTAAWLAGRFRTAWGAARRDVKAARALEEMPESRRAVEDGDVSLSGFRVLVRARDADPEAFARSERLLVDAARIHPVGDLQKLAGAWAERVARERGTGGRRRFMRSVGCMPR